MKLYVLIFLILFLCINLNASGKNIDSLKRAIKTETNGSEKSKLLLETGKAYQDTNIDSAQAYYYRAYQTARLTNATPTIYEALKLLGDAYMAKNKLYSALYYHKTSYYYAKEQKDLKSQGTAAYIIAVDYTEAGDNDSCINYGDTAMLIGNELHDNDLLSFGYNVLSIAYFNMEDFTSALDILNKSITLNELRKDKSAEGRDYMMTANILDLQKKYETSLKYHQKAKSLLAATDDKEGINENETNTAILYREMGNYKHAISILQEELANLPEHNLSWAEICLNLAIAQYDNGDYTDAERNLLEIEKLVHNSVTNVLLESSDYQELANMYLRMKAYDKALAYAKKSEQLFSTTKLPIEDQKNSMLLLSDIYHAKGEPELAYEYYRKYSDLKDTIAVSEQTKNYALAETKFNIAERDKTIKLLSKENELEKTINSKDRTLNILLAISLILGLLFTGLIISAYRKTLKKNEMLSAQKQIINKQVVELEYAANMKSKFLGNISHELRTPVTLLTGMLELMLTQNDKGAVKEKERLEMAYNNSRKLQHMVEEILDLTKLETNTVTPVLVAKEVSGLVSRIVYTFETLIEKEELKLEFSASEANGAYISIDQQRFEKVINNLVYNAIKFNRPGGWIKVNVRKTEDNLVGIEISDSGSGITDADLPHIFEHFYQGSSATAKANGAGIGLSLVKEFTTLMGGAIEVKSEPGVGTTFSLSFPTVDAPMATEDGSAAATLPATAWEHFAERQTVLIVEDNAEMRYYLKEVLGDKVNVAMAGNGVEALNLMTKQLPDLIISDVMMPGMNGKEFITELKQEGNYNKIPLITLTALADVENKLAFLRMGVDDYIVKPFNAEELRIRVYNLLSNQQVRKIAIAEPVATEEVTPYDNKEADEFRKKVTEYVLARMKHTNVSVNDLAHEMALSERQLYRLAKSLTGYTPAQLVKEVRLQKAYELLLSGDIYKVDDVCKRVGFEKASYFSQQFLERFGKRPTEFL